MTTLTDRLQFVLSTGIMPSARAWSLAAGLADSQVHQLINRESTDHGGVWIGTLDKLADAAGLSRIWLAYGLGTIKPHQEKRHGSGTMVKPLVSSARRKTG